MAISYHTLVYEAPYALFTFALVTNEKVESLDLLRSLQGVGI